MNDSSLEKHKVNFHKCKFCSELFHRNVTGDFVNENYKNHLRDVHKGIQNSQYFFIQIQIATGLFTVKRAIGVTCYQCKTHPIFGTGYRMQVRGVLLCQQCKDDGKHPQQHELKSVFGCGHCNFSSFFDFDTMKKHEKNAHKCNFNFCDSLFEGDDFKEEKKNHIKEVHKGNNLLHLCVFSFNILHKLYYSCRRP